MGKFSPANWLTQFAGILPILKNYSKTKLAIT